MKIQQESSIKLGSIHKFDSVLFIVFGIIFIITPYYRGLFFPEDFYWVGFSITIIFLLTILVRFQEIKMFIKEHTYLSLSLLAIPLIYLLSYFNSASSYHAGNEVLQWFSYALVFLMFVIWLRLNRPLKEALWILLWTTMGWIIGMVFLVDLGKLEYTDAILYGRFSSVFQYPNTLASIVSAFIIAGLMGLSKRLTYRYQLIYGLTLVPFMIAFLLTGSRGGFLVFVAAWILGLIFLSWKEQILFITYSVLTFMLSLLGLKKYQGYIQEELFGKASFILITLLVIFAIIVFIIQFFVNRKASLQSNPIYNLLIPVGIFLSGLLTVISMGTALKDKILPLFPEDIQTRINQISLAEDSVQTRILFYKDAFDVWQDHFWFGAGGGAWRALFETYKSLPYHSTQAHSFYMQTLVEVGLIGSIFVFGFIIYLIVKGIWNYFSTDNPSQDKVHLLAPALVIVITMMLHNFIDFNMSFGTYNLFLFSLLAIIWSYTKDSGTRTTILSKVKFVSLTFRQKNILLHTLIGLLILCCLFGAFKSYNYVKAEGLLDQANKGGDFAVLSQQINSAISLHPNNPNLRDLKIQLLNFGHQNSKNKSFIEEIDKEYQQLLEIAPTNHNFYYKYAQLLWDQKEYEQSVQILDKAIEIAPWVQILYEQNIKFRIELLNQHREFFNQEKVDEHVVKLKEIIEQYEEKLRVQSEEKPEGLVLINQLKLTVHNRLLLGKVYYYLGQHEQSLSYLKDINVNDITVEQKESLLLLMLLNNVQLKNNAEVDQIMKGEIAKKINIKPVFENAQDDPLWQPFVENK